MCAATPGAGCNSGSSGGGWGAGIYLDDCVSNATVTKNIVTGRSGAVHIMTHGGQNNVMTGNILDMTVTGGFADNMSWQGDGCTGMTGNVASGNIIVSTTGSQGWNNQSGTNNAPTISANDYYAYAGPTPSSGGAWSDNNPQYFNPQIKGYTFQITAGSPIFNSPVNFPASFPQSGWGPPGFVITTNGTAPSNP